MVLRRIIILIFLLSILPEAFSKEARITNMSLIKTGRSGIVEIQLDGPFKGLPELEIRNDLIQVEIPNAVVWPNINKSINILDNSRTDGELKAYQYKSDLVRARAYLPISFKAQPEKIKLNIEGNKITFSFPLNIQKKLPQSMTIKRKKKKVVQKSPAPAVKKINELDEAYLSALLSDKNDNEIIPAIDKAKALKRTIGAKANEVDSINLGLSAGMKEQKHETVAELRDPLKEKDKGESKKSTGSPDLSKYVLKFVAFLGVIIVFFYGLVRMFKKGAFKRGKLGFLNSTELVKVLSTTYLSPKRSLTMVQVHQQIFLLGNSENGINFISEIGEVADLLKQGEQKITGDNFDSNLNKADLIKNLSEKIKMKEDISQSEGLPAENSLPALRDKIDITKKSKRKFSDELKKKVKALRPLQ